MTDQYHTDVAHDPDRERRIVRARVARAARAARIARQTKENQMTDATQKFIAAQRAIAAQRGGTPSPRDVSQDEPAAPPFSIKLSPERLRDRERAERAEFLNATSSASTSSTRGSGQ